MSARWRYLLALVCALSCGGDGASSPTAPTVTDTETTTTGVTFRGVVTNIITEAPVAGATVTIGKTSVATESDGSFSLAVTAAGQASLSVAATGYYTRESRVSMTGATMVNPEIIPQGDGFDLAFLDHSFRDGGRGTTRWLTQPAFEIRTQMYRCTGDCSSSETTDTAPPAYFETRAREAIAFASDFTGGTVVNPTITTVTYAAGTTVTLEPKSPGRIVFMYVDKFDNPNQGGRTWTTPGGGDARL